jgi:hypothetical protein
MGVALARLFLSEDGRSFRKQQEQGKSETRAYETWGDVEAACQYWSKQGVVGVSLETAAR